MTDYFKKTREKISQQQAELTALLELINSEELEDRRRALSSTLVLNTAREEGVAALLDLHTRYTNGQALPLLESRVFSQSSVVRLCIKGTKSGAHILVNMKEKEVVVGYDVLRASLLACDPLQTYQDATAMLSHIRKVLEEANVKGLSNRRLLNRQVNGFLRDINKQEASYHSLIEKEEQKGPETRVVSEAKRLQAQCAVSADMQSVMDDYQAAGFSVFLPDDRDRHYVLVDERPLWEPFLDDQHPLVADIPAPQMTEEEEMLSSKQDLMYSTAYQKEENAAIRRYHVSVLPVAMYEEAKSEYHLNKRILSSGAMKAWADLCQLDSQLDVVEATPERLEVHHVSFPLVCTIHQSGDITVSRTRPWEDSEPLFTRVGITVFSSSTSFQLFINILARRYQRTSMLWDVR